VDRYVLKDPRMSSSSQIAVAKVYDPSNYSPPAGPASVKLDGAPPLSEGDGAWQAARDSRSPGLADDSLANVWADLVRGRLRAGHQTTTHASIRLIAYVNCAQPPLYPEDAAVLRRVLCGEPQKVLACDLGIANSTVSGRCVRALDELGMSHRTVPLALVLAAQSAAGLVRIPKATSALFEQDGRPCLALTVARPATKYMATLTRAEQEVAQALIEGSTRSEIALRRTTSMFTVTRQFSSIFAALRVTGRCALIRRAAELGCFS
jgi:DNA-binding NarL/FixJ family response regulator